MNFNSIRESLAKIDIGPITLLTVLKTLLLFLVCLISIKIILKISDKILEKSRLEAGPKKLIRTIIKIVLWVIAIIFVTDMLGVNTTSLVAVLSVAGLALSLSVQNVLSNVFSGFTLMSVKPFAVEDFVEINGVTGSVDGIGMFYTRLKTVDNKLVYVPNSEVTSTKIINYTKQGIRRLDLRFKVSYEESALSVKKAILDALQWDQRIMPDPPPFVGVEEYLDTSVQFVMLVWVKSPDYLETLYDLNESVREKLTQHGINMSYSHINVHVIER